MNPEAQARDEYIKFFVLFLFFGALMLGAALLRPFILGEWRLARPTPTLEQTMPTQSLEVPTATASTSLDSSGLSSPMPVATAPLTPTLSVATPEPTPVVQTYTVKPGDTLFKIGRQLGCSVDDLVAANGIVNRNLIVVGQVLSLPGSPPAVPDAPAVAAEQHYTVQWGDTLWALARRYQIEVDTLAAANNITDPTRLRAGSVIVIPH